MCNVMERICFRLCICALLLEQVVCLSVSFMETDALRMEDLEQGMEPINRAAQAEFLPRLARPFNLEASASPQQREREQVFRIATEIAKFRMDSKAGGDSFQQLRRSKRKQEAANSTTDSIEVKTGELHHHVSLPRIIAVVLVTLVGIGCAFMFMEEEDDKEHREGTPEGPAKPPEELLSMKTCDGTWAVTYQNAKDKKGLELLFRCHIIPTQEFANAKVSQEHIDECVWIATHMLRQKPLEEWLNDWPQARDAFDDSVRKCYEERKDARLEHQKTPPSLDAKKQGPPAKGGTKAEGKAKQPLKIGDKKSLMDRCRQIMAASDAGRTPWSSASNSPEKKDGAQSPARARTPPRVPNVYAAKGSNEQTPN